MHTSLTQPPLFTYHAQPKHTGLPRRNKVSPRNDVIVTFALFVTRVLLVLLILHGRKAFPTIRKFGKFLNKINQVTTLIITKAQPVAIPTEGLLNG